MADIITSPSFILERAADQAGSYAEVARRSGISRRRLCKIKSANRAKPAELTALLKIYHGEL